MRYSIYGLMRHAFGGATWPEQWRSPEPRVAYDVVIVGAGGHGLATAYYLAKEHGVRNVAVLERGWLGGGNTGRNTTIIRSNYLWECGALRACAETVGGLVARAELQCHVFAARGVDAGAFGARRAGFQTSRACQRLNGIDNEWLAPEQAQAFCPPLNISPDLRYPILGAALQRRGGVARHDAVAWGYARAASALGVDIIQNCEVTAVSRAPWGAVNAVETTRGRIAARKIAVVAAGHTSVVMAMAGRRAHAATELSVAGAGVRTGETGAALRGNVQQCPHVHLAVGQGRVVIGAGTDAYVSYSQAGGLHISTHTLEAICELFPTFRRLRMLRNWGGIVDVTPDRSPIIALTPVPGLFVNCGWGTGGFKATSGS